MNRNATKGRRVNRRTGRNKRTQPKGPSQVRMVGMFVLALTGITASLVGGHFAWETVRESPQLFVKQVLVTGLDRIEEAELLAYADIGIETPILDVNLDSIALSVNLHPWVAQATIRRKLPDTISIRVTEHEPAMLVALGPLYVANVDGEVFKQLEGDDNLDLPVLMGLAPPAAEDFRTRENNERVIREAIGLTIDMAAQSAALGRLQEIAHHPNLGWSMVTMGLWRADEAMTIHLGREPLRRLSVARQGVSKLKRRTRVPKVIWVDGTKNPDRVHVRFADARHEQSETYIATAR